MRIARFTTPGEDPRFGIVELAEDNGEHPDTIAVVSGDPLVSSVKYTGERLELSDVRLLAPVIPRSKIVGAGSQYASTEADLAKEYPKQPTFFFKPNTTVIGPDDAIIHPAEVTELNFEGELAIVIGRIARKVPLDRVDEVVFGYTVANDVTAADINKTEVGWARAKGWDTFCPLGPWIVTHLKAEDTTNLNIRTTVDGVVKQDDSTALMIRNAAQIVSLASEFTTLLPGDVILTGTPVGAGPVRPGQVVSITVEGIGTLSNPVVEDRDDWGEVE